MRRAELHTHVANPAAVAAALRPDNTDQITTTSTDDAVVTTITRDSTSGLHATIDDYLINLSVATRILTETEPRDRATDDSPTANSESNRL